MEVRQYRGSDRDALIELWAACELVVPQNNPERDIERKLRVGADLFLVGSKAGRIVASVMGGYEGHRGWINYLAVHPQARGRGYGRVMMDAVEARLITLGCPKINLQVRGSNNAVRAFYEALGYQQDDVISLGKRLQPD